MRSISTYIPKQKYLVMMFKISILIFFTYSFHSPGKDMGGYSLVIEMQLAGGGIIEGTCGMIMKVRWTFMTEPPATIEI